MSRFANLSRRRVGAPATPATRHELGRGAHDGAVGGASGQCLLGRQARDGDVGGMCTGAYAFHRVAYVAEAALGALEDERHAAEAAAQVSTAANGKVDKKC